MFTGARPTVRLKLTDENIYCVQDECRIRGNKGETMVVHRSIDALATKSKMFIQMCPCSIYGGVGVAAAVTGVRQ